MVSILAAIVGGVYGVYDGSVQNAKFQQMRANQKLLQAAIEQFHAKTGHYPASLETLTRAYLNTIPDDPTTDFNGNDWLVVGPGDDPQNPAAWRPATSPPAGGVFDVRSRSDQR